MCSVFGALLKNQDRKTHLNKAHHIISDIARESLNRGRDGWGTNIIAKDYSFTNKQINRDRGIGGIFEKFIYSQLALIGNCRAEPTTEYVAEKSKEDQQPYMLEKWSIVHNGTIANDKELRTGKVKTDVDSAAIVEALCVQEPLPGLEKSNYSVFNKTVQHLKGSYAILATNTSEPNAMYVACNYRPIWYVVTELGVFFASAEEYFPDSLVPQMMKPYTTMYFSYHENELFTETHEIRQVPTRKKVLVVASGGLDSTVAAAILKKENYEVELLHFTYGCRAESNEGEAIKNIAREMGLNINYMDVPIYTTEDSNLFDPDATVSGGEEGAEFAHEWVPARNLVMLSIATAFAEAHDFNYIALGNNLEEAGAYPDNEPEFIRKFNKILPFAVGDGKRLEVLMPVGDMMKHEIVAAGYAVGAPMNLCWSCYKNGYKHCGTCGPCFMRRTAFEINNLEKKDISYIGK